MKKYIAILLLVVGFGLTATAQRATILPTVAGDSIVVTGGAADSVFKTIPITAGYTSMGVQVVLKAGTGSVNGKLYLYESVSGNQFILTDSSALAALPAITGTSNSGYTHGAIIRKSNPAGSKYIAVVQNVANITASPVQFSYTARK